MTREVQQTKAVMQALRRFLKLEVSQDSPMAFLLDDYVRLVDGKPANGDIVNTCYLEGYITGVTINHTNSDDGELLTVYADCAPVKVSINNDADSGWAKRFVFTVKYKAQSFELINADVEVGYEYWADVSSVLTIPLLTELGY